MMHFLFFVLKGKKSRKLREILLSFSRTNFEDTEVCRHGELEVCRNVGLESSRNFCSEG